jgi:hypothetical protein
MTPQDLVALFAGLFIFGMIWLRTRTAYSRRYVGTMRLTQAGRIYFALAVIVLALGWIAAPALGRVSTSGMAASSTLVRVIWFLVAYYLFIAVHRLLSTRKIVVFTGQPRA